MCNSSSNERAEYCCFLFSYDEEGDSDYKKRGKMKCLWVRDIFKERKSRGDFHNLVEELRLGDREFFFSNVNMHAGYIAGLRNFVQTLSRGESGTSVLNGHTQPNVENFLVFTLRFVFTRRKRTHA